MKSNLFNSKKIYALLAYLLITINSYAGPDDPDLAGALDGMTEQAKKWVGSFRNFLWVICGIVGFAGMYKVYQKYQNQDTDTLKAGLLWAGGFIFIILANLALKTIFKI